MEGTFQYASSRIQGDARGDSSKAGMAQVLSIISQDIGGVPGRYPGLGASPPKQ